MDGTGDLFADFVRSLPDGFKTRVVRYPTDRFLSYPELEGLVRAAVPAADPFVLLAESFSTPLAIQIAARNPPNLKGLVLCAGFAYSPVLGWMLWVWLLLAPILLRMPLTKFAARLLVGPNAAPSLLGAVRAAISSVQPTVLTERVRAVLKCDVREELARIAVPIVYLRAAQDFLVGPSCLAEVLRIKPMTIVATITGPHLLMQREPRQTADAIARFVRQLDPRLPPER
jgi:pimeloyl-ACP methyl ester carboxylesterase